MRPRVTLSCAQSADGRIATTTGDSQWISGPETLRLAHELRNENDGILAGIGTVIADNPQLTCRIEGGSDPHRVVLDSMLRTPLDSHIATQATNVPTTAFAGPDAPEENARRLEESGVGVVRVSASQSGLDLHEVLAELSNLNVSTLMLEGGAGIITSFLRARLVDRVILVCAPMFIGNGTETVGDLGITSLSDAIRGTTSKVRQAGNDIVWEFDIND